MKRLATGLGCLCESKSRVMGINSKEEGIQPPVSESWA